MRPDLVRSAIVLVLLAGTAKGQLHEPFPPVFELSSLLAVNGGDGSLGVVLEGFELRGLSGYSVASAGDVNGDGVDDVIIGAPSAYYLSGQSYVVFGRDTASVGDFPPSFNLADLDGTNGFRITGSVSYSYSRNL